MKVNVTPEVTGFDGESYTVVLRGSALLEGQARAWYRTAGAWWGAPETPGMDLALQIPKALREAPRGTFFEAAVSWAGSGSWKGPSLWSGSYWVRRTSEGLVLEKAEPAVHS